MSSKTSDHNLSDHKPIRKEKMASGTGRSEGFSSSLMPIRNIKDNEEYIRPRSPYTEIGVTKVYPEITQTTSAPPDSSPISADEKEARIIFQSKFATLRENYPERDYSLYEPTLPLNVIRIMYDNHIRKITAENNMSFTRVIMVILFLCIEGFFVKFLGIDIGGFTKTQLTSMARWDKLLLELGEKYTGETGAWGVEVRIGALTLFNLGSIAVIRFLSTRLGVDQEFASKVLNSLVNGKVDELVQSPPEIKKDPVTNTRDPPTPTRDIIGDIGNVINTAARTFNIDPANIGNNLAETIANMGNNAINPNRNNVAFGSSRKKKPDNT